MGPIEFVSRFWDSDGVGFVAGWDKGGKFWQRPVVGPAEVEWEGVSYFSLHRFDSERRRRSHTLPSRWVGADLDEVDPYGVEPVPTAVVRTSPGRWQAYWFLSRALETPDMEGLAEMLAVVVRADHGSWIATKLFRPVGTFNEKYRERPEVGLEWWDGIVYDPETLVAEYRPEGWNPSRGSRREGGGERLPAEEPWRIWARYVGSLDDRGVRRVYAATWVRDRSAAGWRLAMALAEAGASPAEIVAIHLSRPWCKFTRRPEQAWREARAAVTARGERTKR